MEFRNRNKFSAANDLARLNGLSILIPMNGFVFEATNSKQKIGRDQNETCLHVAYLYDHVLR